MKSFNSMGSGTEISLLVVCFTFSLKILGQWFMNKCRKVKYQCQVFNCMTLLFRTVTVLDLDNPLFLSLFVGGGEREIPSNEKNHERCQSH